MDSRIIAFLAFIAGLFILVYAREIYSKFDHSRWESWAKPNKDAIILEINTQQVKYIKDNAKYKSVVSFSDGFRFTTHKTDRQNYMTGYNISVDKQEVAIMAIIAHQKALKKLEEKGERIYTIDDLADNDPVRIARQKKQMEDEKSAILQRGWRCTCGRTHQKYESSCVCGKTKSECTNSNTQQ